MVQRWHHNFEDYCTDVAMALLNIPYMGIHVYLSTLIFSRKFRLAGANELFLVSRKFPLFGSAQPF